MKVLLDECVDSRLAREIVGHDVTTVPEAGWAAAKNGELLKLAQGTFDVFVTVDGNLQHQQRLADFSVAVIVLRARTNRFVDLQPLVPQLLQLLPTVKRGELTWIEG